MTRRIQRNDPDALVLLAECLQDDGVALIPADTLYGLSATLHSSAAHKRILVIKGYEKPRPMVYLASDLDMVGRYVDSWGCVERERLEGVWPAPLTGIFRSGPRCPLWVGETIAVRVPDVTWLRNVVASNGDLVASTSANPAGSPPLVRLEEIIAWLGDMVDLAVSGAPTLDGQPSTIVDFTGERPRVVRKGAYAWEADANPSN